MSIVSEPLGRVLGNRYRVVATLGTGASAHVFLAEDMVLQRRVAVKVLQPALARDEAFLRRFRAEARSVASLNHPHVLRVFDWGEDEDGPYLVLEYLEGGSLFDMLALGRRLTPSQAARVGAQGAEGLAYAHARGLVHRDVKPANLLFDEEGRVRVADFGVARALASAAMTEPIGTVVGTARYVSPEQAQGAPLDGRSDVYSLALVLYEAVTGGPPFRGETSAAMLHARIGAALPAATALGPLREVLTGAAAPATAERPDAADLARQLERLADDLAPAAPLPLVRRAHVPPMALAGLGALALSSPGDATLAGRTSPAGVPTGEPTAALRLAPGPATTYAPSPGARPVVRRGRRWPWVAAVLLLAALLAGAGAVYAIKTKLFTPSHRLPALVGQSLVSARSQLQVDHFKAVVEPAVQSLTVRAGSVVSQSPGRGAVLKEGTTVRLVPSAGLPTERVPRLSGQIDCAVARQLLIEAHLKARCPALSAYTKTVPQGDVINWSYQGRLYPRTAPWGATIAIAISEGKPPVQMPSFAGQTWTQADSTLTSDGLSAREVKAYSTTVPVGQVVSTTPGTGAVVPADSTITVTVSKGAQTVKVPNVTKETVQKATAALAKVGLTVGRVYGPGTGTVFTTVPLPGQRVKVGTAVTLYTH